jgi:hypothetical protein
MSFIACTAQCQMLEGSYPTILLGKWSSKQSLAVLPAFEGFFLKAVSIFAGSTQGVSSFAAGFRFLQ